MATAAAQDAAVAWTDRVVAADLHAIEAAVTGTAGADAASYAPSDTDSLEVADTRATVPGPTKRAHRPAPTMSRNGPYSAAMQWSQFTTQAGNVVPAYMNLVGTTSLSKGPTHRSAPRRPMTRSSSTGSALSQALKYGRFTTTPADMLEGELTRTSELLGQANEQLSEQRRQAQRDRIRRERENTSRTQAAAERHATDSVAASTQRAQLLHLAEQVAKQRKALEVELRSEQMRRSEREVSEEQWAARVHDLQQQCEAAMTEASQHQHALTQLQEQYTHMRDAWVDSVRSKYQRRHRQRSLSIALERWVEHATTESMYSRVAALMGSEYGVRQRSAKQAMQTWFTVWCFRAREALEEQRAAQLSQRELEQRERIEALEAINAALTSELEGARAAVAAGKERTTTLETQLAEERQKGLEVAEASRAKVIANLHATATRRLRQGGLSRAWTTWVEQYGEVRMLALQRERQAEILNAMRSPQLSHAWYTWRDRWRLRVRMQHQAEKARAEGTSKAGELRLQTLERERNDALESAAVVRSMLVEAQQALSLERTAGAEQREQLKAALEALSSARKAERAAKQASRTRSLAEERERQATGEAQSAKDELVRVREEAMAAAAHQQAAAETELTRLLREQRLHYEGALGGLKAEYEEHIRALQAKIESLEAGAPLPPEPPPTKPSPKLPGWRMEQRARAQAVRWTPDGHEPACDARNSTHGHAAPPKGQSQQSPSEYATTPSRDAPERHTIGSSSTSLVRLENRTGSVQPHPTSPSMRRLSPEPAPRDDKPTSWLFSSSTLDVSPPPYLGAPASWGVRGQVLKVAPRTDQSVGVVGGPPSRRQSEPA